MPIVNSLVSWIACVITVTRVAVGYMLCKGLAGFPPDFTKGHHFITLAAENGLPQGLWFLGVMHLSGELGASKDEELGFGLISKAAEQQVPQAACTNSHFMSVCKSPKLSRSVLSKWNRNCERPGGLVPSVQTGCQSRLHPGNVSTG